LGLEIKVKELGFNGPQAAATIGPIVGRCCEPGSELATHAWPQEKSGRGELIDYDFNNLSLYGFYQVFDQLLKKKAAIEEHLHTREHNPFGVQETIYSILFFYDQSKLFLSISLTLKKNQFEYCNINRHGHFIDEMSQAKTRPLFPVQ